MTSNLSIEDQVIVALRRITRAIDLHSKGLVNEVGLTAPQLATLLAVQRLHPINVSALAKSVHLSQATMTGILNRLEKRGLVPSCKKSSFRLNASQPGVSKDSLGFSQLIRKLNKEKFIQTHCYRRYQHRVAISGEPLYYVAVIARKVKDLDESIFDS